MTNIIMMIFNKKVSIGINILFLGLLMIPCSVYGIDFPDLPVLNIVTVNGEMPTSTIVYAPEGCSGVSITDNEYVPGRMIVTLKGNTLYDTKEYVKGESGMRIKIRGNSTGAYMNQHPYKIKLSKKYDLLERGDKSFKHKDWVLLSMYTWNVKMTNQESNILNIAGTIVSKALNKEWTPDFTFVNVVINDEYQGMYYLMESAERGDKRVIIDDTGFMIEDDTFWWNENIYFKTDYQKTNVAFTYKYPDDDDVTDSIQNIIRNYMNEFERVLYSKGDLYTIFWALTMLQDAIDLFISTITIRIIHIPRNCKWDQYGIMTQLSEAMIGVPYILMTNGSTLQNYLKETISDVYICSYGRV